MALTNSLAHVYDDYVLSEPTTYYHLIIRLYSGLVIVHSIVHVRATRYCYLIVDSRDGRGECGYDIMKATHRVVQIVQERRQTGWVQTSEIIRGHWRLDINETRNNPYFQKGRQRSSVFLPCPDVPLIQMTY